MLPGKSSRSLFFSIGLLFISASGCGGGYSAPPPPVPNPVPTLSGVTPNSATAGNPGLTVTASGSGFIPASVIDWNGTPLNTTFVSATSLTAQVPPADLASTGMATVTVQNPTPGGGTSGTLTFTISQPVTNLTVLDVEGTDLAWNASEKKLYIAVPAAASANPSTIVVVDPVAGIIVRTQQLTSAASGLATSDDNHYLYAVTNGASAIQRFVLPAITPDIQWSLGTDPISGASNLAGDIKVQPGAPHTLAVSMGQFGSGSVAVFDDAVGRPSIAGGGAGSALGNSLQWKPDGTQLYSAYTIGSDSPFFTSVSDDALFVMPVTNTGVGAVTSYDSSFRAEGVHLHLDANAGRVYGDWGEVINVASGVPAGNLPWVRPNSTFLPGPLSVVDPSLKLFYTLLQVPGSGATSAFQIQAFDQTQFRLLHTIVIPNVVGVPVNFIRWGQAGLAVITNGGASSTAGQLYILDGAFVNPSGAADTSVGAPIEPVPTLTGTSPLATAAGSQALTLTVTGRDFTGQSVVYWNGTALPTTVVNGTQLSAQVPSSNLATVGQVAVTVSSGGSALPASNSMPFSVAAAPPAGNTISVYNAGGNDLVWNAGAGKIYVSMPGVQGDLGDAVGVVDPVAGTVTSSGFLGSDPARLSLSDSGQYLYVALYGENAIQQLTVPGLNANSKWNLGGVGTFHGPYYALDLQAAPGAPQTTAVTLANFDVSPSSAAVVIYDGSTPRPSPLQAAAFSYSGLKWGATASTLFAVDQGIPQDFLLLGVGPAGAALNQHYDGIFSSYSRDIHFDVGTGLVYTDGGQALQPSNGTIVGSYAASGIAVPDSTLNRVFILGQTPAQVGTSDYTIQSFDQANFTFVGSIPIQNVVGTPTALIRWGTNGLAFTTRVGAPIDFRGLGPGQLYVVAGSFVNPSAPASQSFITPQLQRVQRTWGLVGGPSHQLRETAVHPSPWRK